MGIRDALHWYESSKVPDRSAICKRPFQMVTKLQKKDTMLKDRTPSFD